jgi:formate dehydrogenase-N alpha subunit
MAITRRQFLQASGATSAALTGLFSMRPVTARAEKLRLRIHYAEQTTTICPYCGVGCGMIVSAEDGKVTNIEGDPDHPINEGSLCSKGNTLYQVVHSERRLKNVLYRRPGGGRWEKKSWNWAMNEIAARIKATRDANWIGKDVRGNTVNRTEAIASTGSVFPNSEEAYLHSKFLRSLGVVYMENEARLCVSSAVAANSETFGRGPMSNHWRDLANSDCIMIIGSNSAETFPNAFKWVTRAKENGAKVIHVDPRFTRTSAKADIYVRIRTGTDIAFVGGMTAYLLDDMAAYPDKYNFEYVKEYTNAAFLINPGFSFNEGLFSGYDAAGKSYDKSTWQYQMDERGVPRMADTLEDPNCVFQLLKKHFARYDAETVCRITGTPKDVFLEACKTFCATGARGKAGAVVSSSAACEHSHGTQNVRSYGILQLLLGNIGIAGGGLNGVTGAVNGLGATLQGLVFAWLPGALPVPKAQDRNLAMYLERVTPPKAKVPKAASPWRSRPKHVVSLLKAWYGKNARADNDYCFELLPKAGGNHSWIPLFKSIEAGKTNGLICWGMNPAVSGPSSEATREALAKLDWMVVSDLWETETAGFWKRPGCDPQKIQTEVFLLPAACSVEKEGSVTSSCRWMQWRNAAVRPPGHARSDLWITNELFKAVRARYQHEGGPNAEAILDMQWHYGTADEPDVHAVAREINGYDLKTEMLLPSLLKLSNDGTTSCGNWLFSGSYTEKGNMACQRGMIDASNIGLYSEWAWAWPLNRRIWYNRASVDMKGKPWDSTRPVIRWDAVARKWLGDVPDGGPPPGAIYPFIMKPEGRGCLFGMGRADGPLPEHYEPWESPVDNPMSAQQFNPVIKIWEQNRGARDTYPILATTFRLVEHMHSGAVTRNLPGLAELMPNMFVEISRQLAAEKDIKNGDMVTVASARGKIRAIACVTGRLQPFTVDGTVVHQVAMPWCFGYGGLAKGDSANCLTAQVADPNTMIPEYRAFLCDISKAG